MARFFLLAALLSGGAMAEDAWMLVRDEQRVTMSGDIRKIEEGLKHYKTIGGQYFWFERGGKRYIVRDGKFLKQFQDAVKGDAVTEAQEQRLDVADADLDRQQGKLEKHQAEIERWEDQPGANEKLHEPQEKLRKDQLAVDREVNKLAREQEKVGKAQERRARQMDRKVAKLIDAALRAHAAQEVR